MKTRNQPKRYISLTDKQYKNLCDLADREYGGRIAEVFNTEAKSKKRSSLSFSIPEAELAALTELAERDHDGNVSALLRQIVRYWLDRDRRKTARDRVRLGFQVSKPD